MKKYTYNSELERLKFNEQKVVRKDDKKFYAGDNKYERSRICGALSRVGKDNQIYLPDGDS